MNTCYPTRVISALVCSAVLSQHTGAENLYCAVYRSIILILILIIIIKILSIVSDDDDDDDDEVHHHHHYYIIT